MAFRRSWNQSGSPARGRSRPWNNRRRFGSGQRFANLARKRRTWVVRYDDQCCEVPVQPGEVCPTYYSQFVMMNPVELKADYSDRAHITRIDGGMWLAAQFANAAQASRSQIMFRWGLYKSDVDTFNPQGETPNPFVLAEWAETKWIERRKKLTVAPSLQQAGFTGTSNGSITFPAIMAGCCSTQDSYVVPPIIAGESPGHIVPAENCIQCHEDPIVATTSMINATGTVLLNRSVIKTFLSFNFRGSISLKENEILSWFVAAENITCPGGIPEPPQVWQEYKDVRARVEV